MLAAVLLGPGLPAFPGHVATGHASRSVPSKSWIRLSCSFTTKILVRHLFRSNRWLRPLGHTTTKRSCRLVVPALRQNDSRAPGCRLALPCHFNFYREPFCTTKLAPEKPLPCKLTHSTVAATCGRHGEHSSPLQDISVHTSHSAWHPFLSLLETIRRYRTLQKVHTPP